MNSGEWVKDFEDSVRQIVRQEIESSLDVLAEKVMKRHLQQIYVRTGLSDKPISSNTSHITLTLDGKVIAESSDADYE